MLRGATPTEAGPTNGTFTFTLDNPAPAGGLTVNFNTTGSGATNPADYTFTTGTNLTALNATSFTVAAGQTTATLNVVPVDDAEVEGAETLNLNLVAGVGYGIDTDTGSAMVTLTDDDFPEVSITAGIIPTEAGPTIGTFAIALDTPAPTGGLNRHLQHHRQSRHESH